MEIEAPPERVTVPVAEDGVTLSTVAWRTDGALPPIALVHGLASNAHLWDGVAVRLAAMGHPVVAVDQRGHGRSDKPNDGYDFATLDRDLLAVFAHYGWTPERAGRPFVAGQSWGGNVVLDLAAHHPVAVGGVALVDGGTIELSARFADWPTCEAALAPPPLSGTRFEEFQRWIRNAHPDWPETGIAGTLANVEVLSDGTIQPWLSRENHLRILRHLWEHRPRPLYPRVEGPAVLIMAENRSNPRWMEGRREEVAAAARSLPRAEVHWIEGDHDLHAQYPDAVAALIHDGAGTVSPS